MVFDSEGTLWPLWSRLLDPKRRVDLTLMLKEDQLMEDVRWRSPNRSAGVLQPKLELRFGNLG